jgi:hypothetical protein
LDEAISKAQMIMGDISEYVLDGFRLSSDVDVVEYPGRYSDERGVQMWETIISLATEGQGRE